MAGFFSKVFEKTHQNAIKKKGRKLKKKKRRHLPTSFSGYLPDTRRFQLLFS
jgi:hypothetical protein